MNDLHKDRRTVLAGLAASAAAVALPGIARGGPDPSGIPSAAEAAEVPACGRAQELVPNVTVLTHEGGRARFHDDLVRGRTVLIHFFSIAGDAAYPTVANLARVQPFLGERLGRDVFLYSVSVDPGRDTPRALRDFAARHGAAPGWLFLTGEPDAMDLLRARFFAHDAGHAHGAPVEDCSRGLLRYGNAAAGLWGSVPAKADPQWIAARLDWVRGGEVASGPPRRRGPVPLSEQAWWPRNAPAAGEERS